MKLFGSLASPFVRHCRIALNTAGLDHVFVETAALASPSPTKRVPFLHDGDLELTDSSSILKHIRNKGGQPFLEDIKSFDLYCMANTLADACISLFLSGKLDEASPTDSKYLQRQVARIESGLKELDAQFPSPKLPLDDAQIRLACTIDWGLFRGILDLQDHPNLSALLDVANSWAPFAETSPR